MDNLEKKWVMKKAMKLLEDKITFCFKAILIELYYTDRFYLMCWAYVNKHGTKMI